MAENKTRPSEASVEDFISTRANAEQQEDLVVLMSLMQRITRTRPRMWGPSIVGYGAYRYRYASGRTGEMPLAAFAIRGRDLVVYLADWPERKGLRAQLGKHRMGKSCLYFRRLSDLDKKVLEELIVGSIAEVKRLYG